MIVAVDADGSSAWELVRGPDEIGAFVLDSDTVWVAGRAEIASYDLGTGEEVGSPIQLGSGYEVFATESIGIRSGGFFLGGWLDDSARILGVTMAGDVEWAMSASVPMDSEWTMGIAALPDGTRACAVIPVVETEDAREQHLLCATAAGEQTLLLEALPTESEGGLSLDDAGNVYVGFGGEVVKLCGPT